MHTIEISAHARITLPCLALHAPLPPPVPHVRADNKTPTVPVFVCLPIKSAALHFHRQQPLVIFFFFPCFTPVITCRATQHCSHNRIRSSTSFDLRRTATAPLNVSWKCPRPSCFEWEPPKWLAVPLLSISVLFGFHFSAVNCYIYTLHIIIASPPSHAFLQSDLLQFASYKAAPHTHPISPHPALGLELRGLTRPCS
ncbi:hypothetical protein CI102_10153 [Trichoderma harzianum]|nr:hypothetical protein CI102_10153 [Trichoderma harzianum]